MDTASFFALGLPVYLGLSLFLCLLFARETIKPPPKSIITSDRVIKPIPAKPKGSKLNFPAGKVAYCTYCDRYLMEESHVEKHESGKKHKENAAGATKWYEFRLKAEADSETKQKSENLDAAIREPQGKDWIP